jgi:hypothetical protein
MGHDHKVSQDESVTHDGYSLDQDIVLIDYRDMGHYLSVTMD